ncbi:MAG: HNH endonuclease [Ktedonobacterales bacterium]
MAEKQRVPEALRHYVRDRALERCKYCLLHESDAYFPYEADHLIAEKHGGLTTPQNLAWACAICNYRKGTDIASNDPDTGHLARLYNPRIQVWHCHFSLAGSHIDPLTAVGRVTVRILRLNDAEHLDERELLVQFGVYPQP